MPGSCQDSWIRIFRTNILRRRYPGQICTTYGPFGGVPVGCSVSCLVLNIDQYWGGSCCRVRNPTFRSLIGSQEPTRANTGWWLSLNASDCVSNRIQGTSNTSHAPSMRCWTTLWTKGALSLCACALPGQSIQQFINCRNSQCEVIPRHQ